jgi:hypothetical protein
MLLEFFSAVWEYLGYFAATYVSPYHNEILAIATIFIALYTFVLARVSRRQVKDARILQRAYLSVESEGVHSLRNKSGYVAHIGIKNFGHLPARAVRWVIAHDFSRDGRRQEFPVDEPNPDEAIIIPPGGTAVREAHLLSTSQGATKPTFSTYGASSLTMTVLGKIERRDFVTVSTDHI